MQLKKKRRKEREALGDKVSFLPLFFCVLNKYILVVNSSLLYFTSGD